MNTQLHVEFLADDHAKRGMRRTAVFGFILDHVVADRRDDLAGMADRVALQLRSQVDLVRSVVRAGSAMMLALRYLCSEAANSELGRSVTIALLVRITDENEQAVTARARALAVQLQAVLRVLAPNHLWQAISDSSKFAAVWRPFDWSTAHVAEIRRREELIDLFGTGRDLDSPAFEAGSKVYLVKPFAPRLTTMARTLHLMMLHSSALAFQVTLAPTQLMEHESQRLRQELVACWPDAPIATAPTHLLNQSDPPEIFLSSYAQTVELMLMNQWLRLQGTPLLMNISVASPEPVPETLVQAIGVDLTRPPGDEMDFARVSGRLLRGDFDVVLPEDEPALLSARQNVAELSFRTWGVSVAPQELLRLRYLVDPIEAATAFRFPLATDQSLPGLRTTAWRIRPIDTATVDAMQSIPSHQRTRLGLAHDLTSQRPVFLGEEERKQHLYIAGQTGTGKTTLLKSMILSDIEAGRGVAVIDPHGDLYAEVLELIPERRADDVVLLDPTDIEFPVGLNLLEASDDVSRWHIAREMRAIMDRLLADQYGTASNQFTGPIFFQHMQMNMLLAMSDPDDPGTLLEFHRIFQQAKYWRRWIPLKWSDPQLKAWVETVLPNTDYTSRKPSEVSMGDYVASKFDEFVFDPMLRLIFGQKRSTINLNKILDEGKILLVNLSKGALSEANSRFLGMVLMGQLQAAAVRRVRLPQHQRRLFCIYVDEFQNLATENFGLLLSESRKFGLSMTLANQFTSQIRTRGLLDAVFGNVGTLIAFRVGREDQEILEPYFGKEIDLASMPNRHAMIRTTIAGHGANPFTLLTELPACDADPARAEWIRTASRTRFGQVRSKVLADIERSMVSARPDTKVEDMDWSVRTRKALQKLNINTVGELTGHTEAELLSCPNLGQTSLDEIKPTMARSGLALRDS